MASDLVIIKFEDSVDHISAKVEQISKLAVDRKKTCNSWSPIFSNCSAAGPRGDRQGRWDRFVVYQACLRRAANTDAR